MAKIKSPKAHKKEGLLIVPEQSVFIWSVEVTLRSEGYLRSKRW
jgi:hypothetical protein